jgi:glycosyltransferase involved in cell wall biosynthesis
MEDNHFLLQVTCMTYNQVNYITDAMNGFVMQQTSFPFVCIIVDDASSDGEPEVIKDYLDANFDRRDIGLSTPEETDEYLRIYAQHKENKNCFFCVLLLKYNHYSIGKAKTKNLAGFTTNVKYIALCEGDDYWTDPLKLQKQVDYMEMHPDCSLCCSDAWILDSGEMVSWKRYESDCAVSVKDIVIGGGMWLQTVTFLYRKTMLVDYPDCCRKCHVGDYPLVIWASLNGDVYCFSDVTAVYRYKSEGSWTSRIKSLSARDQIKGWRSEVDMLKGLDEWSKGRYHDAFNQRIRDYLWYLIKDYRYDSKLLWEEFSNERQVLSKSQRLKWFGYAYTPWFFSIKRKVRRKLKI